MLPMKRPRLSAVQALPDHRLMLTFIDGQQLNLDLSRGPAAVYPGLAAHCWRLALSTVQLLG